MGGRWQEGEYSCRRALSEWKRSVHTTLVSRCFPVLGKTVYPPTFRRKLELFSIYLSCDEREKGASVADAVSEDDNHYLPSSTEHCPC